MPEVLSALQQATQTSRVELRRDDGSQYLDASADGRFVASGSTDPASVIIWDAATGEKLHTLTGPGAHVSEVAISQDGRLVAVSYEYSEADSPVPVVILWDVATGREVSRLMGPARSVVTGGLAFSPDGTTLVTASQQTGTPGRVTVWDVASATERFSFEPVGGVGPVAFRADPPSLLVAGAGEQVGLFSPDDGRVLDTIVHARGARSDRDGGGPRRPLAGARLPGVTRDPAVGPRHARAGVVDRRRGRGT